MQNKEYQNTLRECPFCGGEAIINTIEPHKHAIATFMPDYSGGTFIECTKCSCAIAEESDDAAIKAWNRRAGEQE